MKEFYKGLKDGIPIALGYFAVSFSFGILALKGGLTVFQSVFISLTNVTSAGQFAGLQIIMYYKRGEKVWQKEKSILHYSWLRVWL